MSLGKAAITLAWITVLALVVNAFGAIEGRCSDEGWSGCGWTYQVSGYAVPLSLLGLICVGAVALNRRYRR